jgi:hypothetical protein
VLIEYFGIQLNSLTPWTLGSYHGRNLPEPSDVVGVVHFSSSPELVRRSRKTPSPSIERRRRPSLKLTLAPTVQILGPTFVRLSQGVTHRFAGSLGIARRHRRHDLMVFGRNRGPGFCVVKMGRKLPSQRVAALVKQSHDQLQKYFVRKFRRDVLVKLPIAGQADRLVCRLTYCKENLFECGNVLRLHVPGGFRCDLPFN